MNINISTKTVLQFSTTLENVKRTVEYRKGKPEVIDVSVVGVTIDHAQPLPLEMGEKELREKVNEILTKAVNKEDGYFLATSAMV